MYPRKFGTVAQLVERWPEEPSVVGSIPTGPAKYGLVAQFGSAVALQAKGYGIVPRQVH